MTAPALLIILLAQVIQSVVNQGGFYFLNILLRLMFWFVSVLFVYIATRLLRGKRHYTTTMRVAGFAQGAHVLELLEFLPVIGPLARILALLLAFFGVWIGTATAHELSGWRTILLPVIYIVSLIVGVVFLLAVVQGTAFTVQSLLADFGLVQ